MTTTIEINLIPAKTRQQRFTKPLVAIGITVLVLLVAGIAYLYIEGLQNERQAQVTLNQAQALLQSINKADTIHSSERIALKNGVDALNKAQTHSETMLMMVIRLLPAGCSLSSYNFQGNTLTVSGLFTGLDEVSTFDHELNTNTLFSQATFGGIQSSGPNSYTASFTIQINPSAYKALGGGQT